MAAGGEHYLSASRFGSARRGAGLVSKHNITVGMQAALLVLSIVFPLPCRLTTGLAPVPSPVRDASLMQTEASQWLVVKNPLPASAGGTCSIWIWKIPLKEGMAAHFPVFLLDSPWTEEPGLQSMGCRIRHN